MLLNASIFWFCIAVVAYVYAGYPLLLAAIASLRPRQDFSKHVGESPTVTLLISAYKEEAFVAEKLQNSLSLEFPKDRLQIIVATEGTDDNTADIVRSFADQGVELSYQEERSGKMAAITRALPQARGDIVVFSDANNSYAADTLARLIVPFSDPGIAAVTGSKGIISGDGVLGESEGLYWKYEDFILRKETRLGCCTGAVGEILAVRRELLEPPPAGIINDDFYMIMQLIRRGFRVVYAPDARSYERVSFSAKDEVARRTRIIAGRFQAMSMAHKLLSVTRPVIAWQVISHKFLRPLVPWAMLGAFVTNIVAVASPVNANGYALLSLASPVNQIMLDLQILFYATAILGNRYPVAGLAGKILYLPTFLVNSNKAAVTGLFEYLTSKQTSKWKRVQRR